MAVAPPLPKSLEPGDMRWARWVTEQVKGHETTLTTVKTNSSAAAQQAASAHTKVATVVEKTAAQEAVNPSLPVGPPQVPSAPTLATDHGTVTIKWDGLVHATQSYTPQAGDDSGPLVAPAIGFNHVSASRSTSANGPWEPVGGFIRAAGSLVDTNVVVGTTYYYTFETTDNAQAVSNPSVPSSITVVGVDLGSLNSDVADAISDAAAAAQAGQDAAAAAAAAAATAQAGADSAAGQAATALLNASNAQTAADNANNAALAASGLAAGKGKVWFQTSAPTGNANDLWIDTTGGANTPKRWNGSAWVAVTDKAATDAASAAAAAQTAANNAQTTANTAVTNAAAAQTTANTAQTTANGKNKVIYSTSAASGTTGYVQGDIWFQINGSNVVIAQWQYSGSAWVSRTLDNAVLASLDAGKITSGYIASARIQAGTISASQMVSGTITAGSAVIASGAISTAQIADAAITNAKIGSLAVSDAQIASLSGAKITAGSIVAGSFAAGSIKTNDIAAGNIDTNRLAAGAITADKLSLGAVPQTGTQINRVPAPVTNTTFWSKVVAGTTPGFRYRQATSSAAGLVVAASGTVSLTAQQIQIPDSRKVTIGLVWSPTTLTGYLDWYNAAGTLLSSTSGVGPGTWTAPTGAVYYEYRVVNTSSSATVTITNASVFEVTGSDASQGQSAQLSPAGLQLYDVSGNLALDLTTNSQQFFNVYDNTQADPIAVASIDQQGNAAFTEVSTDNGVDIQGQLFTDLSDPYSLYNSQPNGGAWNPSTGLLDRLARGVVYDVTWDSLDGYAVASGKNSLRIAQDSFILEDGRQYMINLHSGGLQLDNTTDNNVYFELQLSTTPISDITTGTNVMRSVVYASPGQGTFGIQLPVFAASVNQTGIPDKTVLNNRVLPANTQIYWQLDLSQGGTVESAWTLHEYGYARGLSLIDMGASDIMRPTNGADALPNVSNFIQMGPSGTATAGSGSTGTTGTSKTVTFTAKSSRTWNSGGSTQVTGSGQYTNGAAMYYGHGASDMGSWFGQFRDSGGHTMASVLSGKTVTVATLKVKNTYTYMSSGATVQFGTGSMDTAPGSIGTPASNTFNVTFAKGATKSIGLSSAIRTALANGGVQSFVIGVSSSTTNYSYFNGATQGTPPTLTVTYH